MKKFLLIAMGVVTVATAALYGLGRLRKANEEKVELKAGDNDSDDGKEKETGVRLTQPNDKTDQPTLPTLPAEV